MSENKRIIAREVVPDEMDVYLYDGYHGENDYKNL